VSVCRSAACLQWNPTDFRPRSLTRDYDRQRPSSLRQGVSATLSCVGEFARGAICHRIHPKIERAAGADPIRASSESLEGSKRSTVGAIRAVTQRGETRRDRGQTAPVGKLFLAENPDGFSLPRWKPACASAVPSRALRKASNLTIELEAVLLPAPDPVPPSAGLTARPARWIEPTSGSSKSHHVCPSTDKGNIGVSDWPGPRPGEYRCS